MSGKKISEVDCNSIDELWNLLSPAGGKFDQPGRQFIFRGQRESNWALIPTVYRKEVIERYKRGMMTLHADHPGQWFFEFLMLNSFLNFCDSSGLVVPGDSMEFRKYFDLQNLASLHAFNNRDWPQAQVQPLMALAQHHGIPTRLLDWSDNPLVACYHAAQSVVKEDITGSGRLAVFALDRSLIHPGMLLTYVRVPGSTSPYLSFQRGSFILVQNSGFRDEPFTPDVSLESRLPDHPSHILHKLTLPQSLAPELLIRCHKFGISAASVFPGYDGNARAALESFQAHNRIAEG
jgi:hypothetical protein